MVECDEREECGECETCQICYENTNKSTRFKIICGKCNTNCNKEECSKKYIICRECCIKWFKNNNRYECPNCNTVWPIDFLRKIMTKKYMNTVFKQQQIEKLLSDEKNFYRFTIKLLELKKQKKQKKAELKNIKIELESHIDNYIGKFDINNLMKKCSCNNFIISRDNNNSNLIDIVRCRCKEVHKHFDDIARINLKSSITLELLREKEIENKLLYKCIIRKIANKSYMHDEDINNIIKHCQHNNCNGFLSKDWKCNLCNEETCNKCYEAKDDENHKCNEDILKSNKVIFNNKITRSCPNCGIMISKIDGCNHMYCTKCKAKYDWKSGRLLDGRGFHNPHFNQENQGRNIRDFPCGGTPSFEILEYNGQNDYISALHDFTNNILSIIIIFCKRYELLIDRRIETLNISFENNLDIREKFLLKEISIKSFGSLLLKNYKSKKKKYESDKLSETLYYILTDILRNSMYEENIEVRHKNVLECISWIDYYNTLYYTKIHKVYGGAFYNINIKNFSPGIYNPLNDHMWETSINTEEEAMVLFKDKYNMIANKYTHDNVHPITNYIFKYKLFESKI
tara:strand:- start:794 stop:2506 length:1713 start_codon:yes stop_codon:yes gene_type:complete